MGFLGVGGYMNLINSVWSWIHNFPSPYKIMIIVICGGIHFLASPWTKELLYGPEWDYTYDQGAEKAIFETGTELKNGEITVRTQLEFKYGSKVFFILEIEGLYNKNKVNLSDAEINCTDNNDEKQKSRFILIVEEQQRDKLDTFEVRLYNLLREYLEKEYNGDFNADRFDINEKQIAEISYQSINMNRKSIEPMYVLASEEEASTIIKKEVIMRSPHISIDIDELNFDESFYTNEKIMEIIKICIQKVDID